MRSATSFKWMFAILFAFTIAASDTEAFAQDTDFEKQVRAVPVFGTTVLPQIEAALVKEGYGKSKDGDSFVVDWTEKSFLANIYYSNPATGRAAVIVVLGNIEDGVKIDAIITSSEFM
ncbi:MAG TPA: hypothetical protein VM432_04245 [Bdellovibrionales bacterium]|nr:hypothetical protein [Bdellovibrionales bacterium]